MRGLSRSSRYLRAASNVPRILLAVGVVSLIGAIGAPGLANASQPAVHVNRAALHVSLVRGLRMHPAKEAARSDRSVLRSTSTHPDTTIYLYVSTTGTDSGSCRLSTNPCQTISYALSVAPAASIIKVANGTYAEQLVDPGTLKVTIEGYATTDEPDVIIEPSTLTTSDTTTDSSSPQYAIVDAQPGSNVKLKDLTINGSVAGSGSQFNGCSEGFDGVLFNDAKGKMTNVTVTDVELDQANFGCQQGQAIYAASDAGDTTKVTMTSVTVTAYDKTGIACDDAGTTCTIADSTITGVGPTTLTAQNGIQGYAAKSLTIDDGTSVSGNSYDGPTYVSCGILLYDDSASTVSDVTSDSSDVDIYDEAVDGPAHATVSITGDTGSNATNYENQGGVGIAVDSATSGTVEGNTVTGDTGGGIYAWGVDDMAISSNSASGNYLGIYLGGPGSNNAGSSSNTVSSNTVSTETTDGIYADTDATMNTFSSNVGKNDMNYDFQDFSTGTGTANTANTWSSNHCKPAGDSDPEGIC
jgi:parallel beta-helix repeat protein